MATNTSQKAVRAKDQYSLASSVYMARTLILMVRRSRGVQM